MATNPLTFSQWLQNSAVPEHRLTAPQREVLQAAFHFLDHRGRDYSSRRLLSHFLLHAGTGLKVAQLARLLGISRSAASAQQGLSSKEVVQATQHRFAGRAHGKLLPRFAGPIAHFLHAQPQSTRWDLLDFIQRTWGVSVSRVALHRFLQKYGLDNASQVVDLSLPAAAPEHSDTPVAPVAAAAPADPGGLRSASGVPPPSAEFFLPPPSMPGLSCCCPPPSVGWTSPGTVSPTSMVR
jgi:hypothetical protein